MIGLKSSQSEIGLLLLLNDRKWELFMINVTGTFLVLNDFESENFSWSMILIHFFCCVTGSENFSCSMLLAHCCCWMTESENLLWRMLLVFLSAEWYKKGLFTAFDWLLLKLKILWKIETISDRLLLTLCFHC